MRWRWWWWGLWYIYLLAQSPKGRQRGVGVRNTGMRGSKGGGAGQDMSYMNERRVDELDPEWRTKTGRRVMKCKHALSCHVRAIGLEFYN